MISFPSGFFAKLSILVIVLALADLLYLNWWVIKQKPTASVTEPKVQEAAASPAVFASPSVSPVASARAVASPSPTTIIETRTIVEKETQTIVQTSQKEIFIPIGSGSTNSNSYADLSGLEVTIDTSKYSPIESVVFEGSIRVQDGNGKMYARLYSVNEGGVVGSEISTSSATSTLNSSGKFSLGGSKTYRVQAKTDITSYKAYIENARVKITLK